MKPSRSEARKHRACSESDTPTVPQPPNRRESRPPRLADVQAVARDNEHAERRVHHDLGLIEAVDILYTGDRQALAAG